jgi:hypothetical protein
LKIAQANVAVLLSDEGHQVLQLAVPELSESRVVSFYVQDTDDLGIWVRIKREDGNHVLLIRWEYILTVDFPVGRTRTIGLRAEG